MTWPDITWKSGSRLHLHLLSGWGIIWDCKSFSPLTIWNSFRSKGCLCRRCRWWKDPQKNQNWKTHHHLSLAPNFSCFLPAKRINKSSGCSGFIARHWEDKLASVVTLGGLRQNCDILLALTPKHWWFAWRWFSLFPLRYAFRFQVCIGGYML